MLSNTYRNTQLASAKPFQDRSIICLLSGSIAAGALNNCFQLAEPLQQSRVANRVDLQRPRMLVHPSAKESKDSREKQRKLARSKEEEIQKGSGTQKVVMVSGPKGSDGKCHGELLCLRCRGTPEQ